MTVVTANISISIGADAVTEATKAKAPEPERRRSKITSVLLRTLPVGRTISDNGLTARKQTPSGPVVLSFVYRDRGGATRWIKIGRFGTITLDQARTACKRLAGEIVAGRDPAAERQRLRDEAKRRREAQP